MLGAAIRQTGQGGGGIRVLMEIRVWLGRCTMKKELMVYNCDNCNEKKARCYQSVQEGPDVMLGMGAIREDFLKEGLCKRRPKGDR